ncbi:MAG: thioredoxin [Parasporobacterium sp.]|nr:thioredoxin [Parasporobacterium sp.]
MSIVTITQNNFNEEVLQSNTTVLLDFWASWCGPCKMLAPVLEEIAAERADLKIGKINVDEQPQLASQFGIMSIPTLLVFKDGKQVNQGIGYMPKENVLKLL